MPDELLAYYNSELTWLRRMGAEFAEKHKAVAERLLLEDHQGTDPFVERLIEAVAFLTARVHLKIDDEFPEISQALLGVLYPHYIRPIPSMTVVQFHLDPDGGGATTKFTVPRHSTLFSKPVDGYPCKFRTCYDTAVWPLTIANAQWTTPELLRPIVKDTGAVAALRIEISCHGDLTFPQLAPGDFRFYLDGESATVHSIYELLCNNCFRILVRDPKRPKAEPVALPKSSLTPAGFDETESLLPYSRRSFGGYRLLQEYLSFPQKFLFLDLAALGSAWSGFQTQAELIFLMKPFERKSRQQTLEREVTRDTFRLGCSPAINLFSHTAEPILAEQTRSEYRVAPDVNRRNAIEIFSIDEVLSEDLRSREIVRHEPFYSFRHGASREKTQFFWHATRVASMRRNDAGTEMDLSLVDLSGGPARPGMDSITVRCTCTNRDLPSRLPFGDEKGDFELEGAAAVKRIVALRKPTETLRPPLGESLLWRLISHLSLNYLSLVEEGTEALREILKLYNFSAAPSFEKQIAGIVNVKSERRFDRVSWENETGFAPGMRIQMEFDEDSFEGAGVYLFASVLERFLGLYVSLNGFTQLVVSTRQRKEVLKTWRPRAGTSILT